MSENRYIPLSEASEQINDSENYPRISWEVEFPNYMPAEQIGINPQALNRFARLSGFSHLAFTNQSASNEKLTPGVTGVDSSGNATAAYNLTGRKPRLSNITAEKFSGDIYNSHYYDYFWPNGTCSLDTNAMLDKLSSQKQASLRQPTAWAKLLNTTIQTSFRRGATEVMMHSVPPVAMLEPLMALVGGASIPMIQGHSSLWRYLILIGMPVYQFATHPAMGQILHKLSPNQRRWGLLPNLQIDRILAVNGLSRMTTFAKSLD